MRVSQELSLIFPLRPAVPVISVSTVAVLVFPAVSPGVEAARSLPHGQDVARHLALVNSEFARSVLCALPLLREGERHEGDFPAAFQTPDAFREAVKGDR